MAPRPNRRFISLVAAGDFSVGSERSRRHKQTRVRATGSDDERARHEGGIPGHGRGARHAQVRLRASRRSRAPPPVPSGREKSRVHFVILHSPSPSAEPQPTMTRASPCSPFPISSSRSPGVAEDELVDNLRELVDRTGARLVLSSDWRVPARPRRVRAHPRATRPPVARQDPRARIAVHAASRDGDTRVDRRPKRAGRGRRRRARSPRPHPTVASPSPLGFRRPPRPGHALRRARRPRADPRAVRRGARGQAHHDARERGADARAAVDAAAAARGIGLWGTRSSHPAVGPGCSAGGDKQRRRLPHAVGGAVRRGGFSPEADANAIVVTAFAGVHRRRRRPDVRRRDVPRI